MAAQTTSGAGTLRATLTNGMRVVIIRNSLAPVVTVETNFIVGGDETPEGFPGMAHAEEHMAFRGCTGMTADQTAAIYAQMGGENNADTQQNITQYFATVPAADVDVALGAEAACMRGADDSQEEWSKERGAIEQEVARDLSNPTYKFIDRMNGDMFAGTPYAHDPLGTQELVRCDDGRDAEGVLRQVVYAGERDPGDCGRCGSGGDAGEDQGDVRQDSRAMRCRSGRRFSWQPVKPESFTLDSNLPYMLGFIA